MSIKKNFFYQMIYEILVIILPLVTSPYLARVIGAKGVGVYSYAYSVAYYFVLVAMLGIKNYGNREIAKVRDDQERMNHLFSDIFFIHACIAIIVTLAYAIYAVNLQEDQVIALTQIFFVASTVFDISWFYFGIEKFKLSVTRSTFIKILNVLLIFLLVREKADLWKYCLIMSLCSLISQLALWIPLHKFVSFRKPQWNKLGKHLKPLFILFLPAVAVSLYKYMDKIMLGALSSKAEVGYYANAEKVINIPMTIVGAFGTVMLPKMSNLTTYKSSKTAERYMKLSMQMLMCLAFALAYGLASVANVFSVAFWGDEFASCGPIIVGLALTIPFVTFANIIRTQYMIPHNMDIAYTIAVFLGALVNLAINWNFIPRYGAMGAVFGTIVTEILVCVAHIISVKKNVDTMKYIKICIPYILYGAFMYLVVSNIVNKEAPLKALIIKVLIGGIIYVAVSLFYFLITRNEVLIHMLLNAKEKLNRGRINGSKGK